LWLRDPLAVYGVENAVLAPGYGVVSTRTNCFDTETIFV